MFCNIWISITVLSVALDCYRMCETVKCQFFPFCLIFIKTTHYYYSEAGGQKRKKKTTTKKKTDAFRYITSLTGQLWEPSCEVTVSLLCASMFVGENVSLSLLKNIYTFLPFRGSVHSLNKEMLYQACVFIVNVLLNVILSCHAHLALQCLTAALRSRTRTVSKGCRGIFKWSQSKRPFTVK